MDKEYFVLTENEFKDAQKYIEFLDYGDDENMHTLSSFNPVEIEVNDLDKRPLYLNNVRYNCIERHGDGEIILSPESIDTLWVHDTFTVRLPFINTIKLCYITEGQLLLSKHKVFIENMLCVWRNIGDVISLNAVYDTLTIRFELHCKFKSPVQELNITSVIGHCLYFEAQRASENYIINELYFHCTSFSELRVSGNGKVYIEKLYIDADYMTAQTAVEELFKIKKTFETNRHVLEVYVNETEFEGKFNGKHIQVKNKKYVRILAKKHY